MFLEILNNIGHNLFKPLIMFFAMGLVASMLNVKIKFPEALYQTLSLYLLLAIGWHGGEELAQISPDQYSEVFVIVLLGMACNLVIGLTAYQVLKRIPSLNKINAATISGYYGSDSAGTFVTCIGVLTALNLTFASYSPVMLAAMEIPGCLVALFLTSRIRMSAAGINAGAVGMKMAVGQSFSSSSAPMNSAPLNVKASFIDRNFSWLNKNLLHEVFLNPSIFLLFGGIVVGFIARSQGKDVVSSGDQLLNNLFQGVLCLFLFEMGITASNHLKDIRQAGWKLVAFALIAPNFFALFAITILSFVTSITGLNISLGTTVVFSILCASASYIALPALQRMAIPEASPSLPLIASLGVTFTYNVTIGISLYISMAKMIRPLFGLAI